MAAQRRVDVDRHYVVLATSHGSIEWQCVHGMMSDDGNEEGLRNGDEAESVSDLKKREFCDGAD